MCHFSSYWGGGVPAIRDIIYFVFYPKLELSLLGIPANRAHPKQDSTNSNN